MALTSQGEDEEQEPVGACHSRAHPVTVTCELHVTYIGAHAIIIIFRYMAMHI